MWGRIEVTCTSTGSYNIVSNIGYLKFKVRGKNSSHFFVEWSSAGIGLEGLTNLSVVLNGIFELLRFSEIIQKGVLSSFISVLYLLSKSLLLI